MLRTIGWITWLFAYLFTRLPWYWKARRLQKQGKTEEHRALTDKQVTLWTARLLRHLKVTVEVHGKEHLPAEGEVVVFAANHQSFVDIPVLLNKLDKPHGLMAKTELGKIPLLRGWMNEIGCVYVDRDDARASMKALKDAEETLRRGESFTVFPEGTRAKGDEVGEFKAGAVRMATKTGSPIIPVAIDGTYKALEGNGFRLKPAHVRLFILPRVEVAGLSRPEQKELPERLQRMISAAKAK